MHKQFIENAISKIKDDPNVLGLAAGGSMITNQIDEFSDLDLILVTNEKISDDRSKMQYYAECFGNLLNCFTGDHVGEKRLLVCMYDNPLFHVDIKFVTLAEFYHRIEDPVILWERNGKLTYVILNSEAKWPPLDFQWIEDRFWIWIHYSSLKIGRGEYFESLDCISFLRANVISPLMQKKNKQLPRGLRKVEKHFDPDDIEKLKETAANYSTQSIISSLEKEIMLYRELREELFPKDTILRTQTEAKCVEYFFEIKKRVINEK